MAILAWGEPLAVGVRQLDERHRALVGALNDLEAGLRKGRKAGAQASRVKALVDRAADAFALEEKLMLVHDEPRYIAHKARHDEFLDRLREFHVRLAADQTRLSMEFIEFAADWLASHIRDFDRDCGEFLKGKGVGGTN